MTKNWHVGKILLLWAVDLMILGMVLWGSYRPERRSLWGNETPLYIIPYKEFGAWLVLSLLLIVFTWRWLTWRERQQGGQIAREGRNLTGLNLERGFRRITWAVSIGVLAIGASLIVPGWWSALALWNQAGEPPSGVLTVYGPIVGVATFPTDSTEAEIKEALDDVVKKRLNAFHEDVYKTRGKKPPMIDDLPPPPHSPLTTYIYQPPSRATPSVLYSRKALLQAEAKGELSPEVKAILPDLRNRDWYTPPLPGPLRNPFGGWVLFKLLVLALCVAAPWGVFFLVRWLVFGFKPDSAPMSQGK